ncbi:hypothetical protein EUGRSUZ_H04309 [Eucalyptus grandis]|uniref:Uncharacterized protein n=2 Tax=Eucalyptus grandis TaxID=71139 RepID=A0ACC3JX44_EUCGR|nr:hypothetical protein EUGRSUZ_H04309 [Eucalyptus grandis]
MWDRAPFLAHVRGPRRGRTAIPPPHAPPLGPSQRQKSNTYWPHVRTCPNVSNMLDYVLGCQRTRKTCPCFIAPNFFLCFSSLPITPYSSSSSSFIAIIRCSTKCRKDGKIEVLLQSAAPPFLLVAVMVQVFKGVNPASSPHCRQRSITQDIDPAMQHRIASTPKLSSSGNKLVAVPPLEALVEGIYVGEGKVIYLTRTGVEEMSIHHFHQEGKKLYSLRLYAYGRPQLGYWLSKWGTCTSLPKTKSPQEVVNKARELHEHDSFGKYDLINSNCEHFASFCWASIQASTQTALVSACL